MTLIEKIKQIERVHGLIRRKATGSPGELAARLSMSERCLYNLINLMKEMGGPIYFCNQRNSYCYEEQVQFSIGFVSNGKARNIHGGRSITNFVNYWKIEENMQ